MQMNSRKAKLEFQRRFLDRAGQNFVHVKHMMDALPNVGFYIKDIHDRIVTLNIRNCEISALKDEFDAIGRKSSDLFPETISRECLARDALVRKTGKAVVAEEHNMAGGLGEAVSGVLAAECPARIGFVNGADRFGGSGTPAELMKAYGLDAEGIAAAVRKLLK